MIFYFTATGNSLYVAKQLDTKLISIPQVIHKECLEFEDETIGIVCPVFGHEVPEMVRAFMQKAVFKTEYFYMILTYGNRHGGAAELADELANRIGITAAYINTIMMVDNFLPAFDMDEQRKLDKKVDEHIAEIKADIQKKKFAVQTATDADRAAHREFLSRSSKNTSERFKNLYHITETCIGCGICVKVCPAGCFHIELGKAVQKDDNCQACMACIHHCPHKAIRLNVPEKNPNARYRNEHIALNEIIAANQQKESNKDGGNSL